MIVRWGFQAYSLEIGSWCVTYRSEVGQENSGPIGSSKCMWWLGRKGTFRYSRSDLKDGVVSLEYCTGIYCCRVICFQLTTETLPFIILKDTWLPVLRRKFETGCRRMNSAPVIQETRMNRLVCPLQSYRLCGGVHLQETLNVLRQDN